MTNNGGKPLVGVIVGMVVGVVAIVMTVAGCGNSSSTVDLNYPAKLVGASVVAGKPAKNTVDVYEDLLCPYCGRLETRDGDKISQAIGSGDVQVVYHPVAILNRNTTPTGYSLRAANAVLCSAVDGFFPGYHRKLYAEQPAESSAGLTNAELIAKAQDLLGKAPSPAFVSCVNSSKFSKAITTETLKIGSNATLRAPGEHGFGTPTVMVNNKFADVSDDSWLTNLTKPAS